MKVILLHLSKLFIEVLELTMQDFLLESLGTILVLESHHVLSQTIDFIVAHFDLKLCI